MIGKMDWNEERGKEPGFVIEERNSFNARRTYTYSFTKAKFSDHSDGRIVMKENNEQWKSAQNFFLDVFLPKGFPHSVSKDYLKYQFWDSVQAFSSSISSSIATHSVLKGVGVGNDNASPIAATITWLIKDGTSMIGRIIFAWLQGTKFDSDCKKWRIFADILNDMSIFVDLLASHFENHFMLIICISGLFKSLVGVAGGATRAALTQHQARKNNMADVSAKDGSQETLVNLLALICSIIILPSVTANAVISWMLFIFMTVVHLLANYCAVKSVCMETFNEQRFRIYANHYITSNLRDCLNIDDVNHQESIFFSIWKPKFAVTIGASFKNIIEHKKIQDIQRLLQVYEKSDYILSLSKLRDTFQVDILLSQKATPLTQIEALYQACFIEYKLGQETRILTSEDLELISRNFTLQTFPYFKEKSELRGFNFHTILFNTGTWRSEW